MKHIENLIWDLDGVLFPYTPECLAAITQAISTAAPLLDPSLTTNEAFALADQSQKTHRNHFTLLIERGIPFDQLVKHSYAAMDLSFLQPDPALIAAFEYANTRNAILTRSDGPWVTRILAQCHLTPFFPEEWIFATDNDPAMDKAASTHPFLAVLEKTGFVANKTAMIEDRERNLKFAHEAGLSTILIQQNSMTKPSQAAYIDATYSTPLHLMRQFI